MDFVFYIQTLKTLILFLLKDLNLLSLSKKEAAIYIIFACCFSQVEAIEKRCLELFARDYKYSVIHNPNGEVCGHYPRQIVFLEYECTDVDRDRDRDRYFSIIWLVPTCLDAKSSLFTYK